MSLSNTQKINKVHLKMALSCRKIARKENEQCFALALQSAEIFCKFFDQPGINEHLGLSSCEITCLTEQQFEEIYHLLLSYLAHIPISEINSTFAEDTERVAGDKYLKKFRSTNFEEISAAIKSMPAGFSLNSYTATKAIIEITGWKNSELKVIGEILDFIAFNNFEPSIAKAPKGGCFVATTVYGSHRHPNVLCLQVFRDNHLVTTKCGRAFVRCYYFAGPYLAIVLSRHPLFLRLTKRILDRAVTLLRYKWS